MSAEVLYRKWRPQTLDEVVGQEVVTTTLLNAVRADRVGHAYLFCGPRGTGKTSTGRILAKAVNCLHPKGGEPCNQCEACASISEGRCLDVIEIDAASNRGVDDIRSLRERVNYAAGTVRRKVYIVDEVHMLTDAASNALLKTLEEPPPHVMFILATTEFHKVLPTIVSRCQSFHFRRLSLNAIAAKLQLVCQREDIHADDETLSAIARAAGGSLRDAENVLQQLVASRGRMLTLPDVQRELGMGDEACVLRLIDSLLSPDLAGGLRVLHQASDDGIDMRNFGRQVVSALRDVLLVQAGCDDILDCDVERRQQLHTLAKHTTTADASRFARRFSEATARDVSQPLLALELAFVNCVVGGEEERRRDVSRQDDPTGTTDVGGAVRVAGGERRASSRVKRHDAAVSTRVTGIGAVVQGGAASGTCMPPTDAILGGVPVSLGVEDVDSTERTAPPGDGETLSGTPDMTGNVLATEQGVTEPVPGELGHVRARWKEYVDSLRGLGSTGNLDAFLRSACEPVAVEGDVLVLRFAHDFHKGKVEDPKYRHVVEQRLEQFYGRPFKVSCVLESSENVAAAAVPPPGSNPERHEGMLDAALRMGARPKKQK